VQNGAPHSADMTEPVFKANTVRLRTRIVPNPPVAHLQAAAHIVTAQYFADAAAAALEGFFDRAHTIPA